VWLVDLSDFVRFPRDQYGGVQSSINNGALEVRFWVVVPSNKT
jgi:hypothetical protein